MVPLHKKREKQETQFLLRQSIDRVEICRKLIGSHGVSGKITKIWNEIVPLIEESGHLASTVSR